MAETAKPRIWLIVLLAGISVVACIGISLPDWHPWYSSENAARLEQLRKDIPGLKDKSIAQYLEENPSEKTQPWFYQPPVEYPALERNAARFAVVSSLWLVLMVPVVIYGALQFDKARAERQRLELAERQQLEAMERQRLAAMEAANAGEIQDGDVIRPVALVSTMKCQYCGQLFVTNGLAPGNCPHCGGIVQVSVG